MGKTEKQKKQKKKKGLKVLGIVVLLIVAFCVTHFYRFSWVVDENCEVVVSRITHLYIGKVTHSNSATMESRKKIVFGILKKEDYRQLKEAGIAGYGGMCLIFPNK